MSRPGSKGWYVEIDHSSGRTHTPTVLGKPEKRPTINGLPEIEISVPRDEKWKESGFDKAPMRVWKDGVRQPIEELQRARFTEGNTKLEGIGGVELYNRVQKNIQFEKSHIVGENIVSNNTSYQTNFDAPNSETFQTEIQSASGDNAGTFAQTESRDTPIFYGSPTVTHTEVSYLEEAEDATQSGGWANTSSSDATDGNTVAISELDASILSSHVFDHEMPAGDIQPALRIASPTSNPPGFEVQIDGVKVYEIAAGGWSSSNTDHSWLNDTTGVANDSPAYTDTSNAITVEIIINDSTGDDLYVDLIGLHDSRYPKNFDNTLDANDELSGPERFTSSIDVEWKSIKTGFQATQATLEVSMDDTSNGQELAISSDNGDTWSTASNTSSFTSTFGSATDIVKARTTLSHYGTQTETPTNGVNAQQIDSYSLKATLDDTPVLSERSFDNRIIDILNTIATEGNFVWEVRWDEAASSISIEWTQPGQRTSNESANIIKYQADKQTRSQVEKATVFGSAISRRAVDWYAFSGSEFDNLPDDRIVEGSEVVYDDNNEYRRGIDYEINYLEGKIRELSSGGIASGNSYKIDYRHKAYASYAADGVTDPRERVFDNTSLTIDGLCTIAAKIIVDRAKNPLWEVRVIIPKQPVGWNVIDQVNPDELPSTENLQIREITETPEKLVLRLASRRTAAEIISNIENIASKNARKV